ncbi:NUMOD1 domain-containing DNA-binding protein [Lutibacter sp.]|uniref:NUMOD1 domain-containing DNA-binding protein n=1 Tax=Lutibacter sp. TaxID=1925666 RepID=UPI002736B831|nr:NUMOD1 domain-containing DNA-binding protein [Lutibacter sp.]MDP3314375.1 NUMOD1 domain-containing DNA-binding protein [Lutibacter sp.]
MMKEEYNYIIYKAQNTVNGELYIGATTNSIHQRKLDHLERAARGEEGKFQEAIGTYGAEAFKWEQVDTASCADELAQMEQKYINEFNSKDAGYNSSIGGDFKKTVYQYNLIDGILVNSYNCLTDAGNAVNATKQCISRACLSVNKAYNGFYWSYNFTEPFKPDLDTRKKEVLQYSLEGSFISKFVSVADASRQIGLSKTCISRSCRGERANSGGYIWKYS